MDLNILLRGQSNALLLAEAEAWAGARRLVAEVERLLGFDGVADRVVLHYASANPHGNTVHAGTAFLGEWIAPAPAGWQAGWSVGAPERSLLDFIGALSPADRAEPTAVVWLHSEYDSRRADLGAEEWVSGVRFDAALVRAAFGQPAEALPYLFVSAHPYWGSDTGHQAIRLGMETLAAEPAFNARIAARALDLDLSRDDTDGNPATIDYGGPHVDGADALLVAGRIARALAETWAAHAKPGSPIALAGGAISDQGPGVVAARVLDDGRVEVRVALDAGALLQPLGAEAARGAGWSAAVPGAMVRASGAEWLDGERLALTFAGPLHGAARLHYGWGYGRLAGADGRGHGNAVYDAQGMPLWAPAAGVAIADTAAAARPLDLTLGAGPDALVLRLSQDAHAQSAQVRVTIDGVALGPVVTLGAVQGLATDQLTLRCDWSPGVHVLTIEYLNGEWAPRRLHVEAILYDGVAQPGAGTALLNPGAHEFRFVEPPPQRHGSVTDGDAATTVAMQAEPWPF